VHVIREYRHPDDYPAVLALWESIERGIHLGRSDTEVEIGRKQAHDPELCLVALSGERIVGALMGGYDGRRGLLYHLGVAEAFRNQGIGRALMAEMEARLRKQGCLKCYLLVTRDNPDAIGYYMAQGWSEITDVRLLSKEFEP